MSKRKTILLTGASGVVGSALLPRLAGHRVIALTHRHEVATECVRGDVSRPLLDLDAKTYGALTSAVDSVVHCAAVTEFAAGEDATRDLNVAGTGQMLRLAEDAGAQFVYVSTAFVARAGLTRTARGGETGEAVARPDDYLASKRAAEQLVRDSGLRAVIARPSIVIGDSRTGEIAQMQGLLAMAVAVLKGVVPLLPLEAGAQLDLIPQDLVADGLAALVNHDISAGEYWLTSGSAAITAARATELCVPVGRRLGLDVTPPRLVHPAMVDRLIRPAFIDPLPAKLRRRFDDALELTAVFSEAEPFPTSLGELPGCAAPAPAAIEDAFCATVEYLARAKGLARLAAA